MLSANRRLKLCSNCAKQATRKNFRVGRKRAQQDATPSEAVSHATAS